MNYFFFSHLLEILSEHYHKNHIFLYYDRVTITCDKNRRSHSAEVYLPVNFYFFQESRKNFDQILEFFRKLEVNLRAFSGISNSIFGFLLGLQKLASKLARSVQYIISSVSISSFLRLNDQVFWSNIQWLIFSTIHKNNIADKPGWEITNIFLTLTFTLDSMTSFKNVILSSSPMHLRKLQKMHQTFQNPDPVQPDSQYQYLMEKAYTTARKGAIIHFFFERLSRETYPLWGQGDL